MTKIFQYLKNQKEFKIKTEGISMLPILLPNDVIYYRKTSFAKVRINDIVLVLKNERLITHEIIYKTKNFIITKGNNNPAADGRTYKKQVIAKAYKAIRNGSMLNIENIYLLQSTVYWGEIVKIKKILEKLEISHVFLKGLPVHLFYESGHPRRVYADCDIVIDKSRFDDVEKIMLGLRYKEYNQSLSVIHSFLRQKTTEILFYKLINGIMVSFDMHLEVDWMSQQIGRLEEFYPQKLIDSLTEGFLKTKRKVKIQNELFYMLHSQFLILYLCLHFFHHNFRGAFRLEFIDKIIRKSKLNQNEMEKIAHLINEYQLNNFVYPVFILLKKYYKTPIPAKFFQVIKPSRFYTFKLLHFDQINIFNDESRLTAGVNRFKYLFFLSSNPWWRKMTVVFNPQVVFSVFWVFQKKLSSFFSVLRQAL